MAALLSALLLSQSEPLLKPMQQVAKRLDEDFAKFRKGEAEAFKPWPVECRDADKLRSDLKQAGVASVVNLGFEVELYLLKEGKSIHVVRTFVVCVGDALGFLEVRGSKPISDAPQSAPPDALKDHAAPFAQVARGIFAAIQTNDAAAFVFADLTKVKALPEELRTSGEKAVDDVKKSLARTLQEAASAGADGFRVHLDDQTFLALGADGTALGLIRCHFRLREDGALSFEIGRYRPRRP